MSDIELVFNEETSSSQWFTALDGTQFRVKYTTYGATPMLVYWLEDNSGRPVSSVFSSPSTACDLIRARVYPRTVAPLPDEIKYLVWSYRHHKWHRARNSGYTEDPRQAGRYSAAEVMSIVLNALPGQNIAVDTTLAERLGVEEDVEERISVWQRI